MKRTGSWKRLMTLLLALVMTANPVLAATGDICYNGDYHADGTQGNYLGITGLDGNIDTTDTISWPIKVYDYLNDGMLFEYSQSQATSVAIDQGSPYGGRTYMPSVGVGNDYTYNGVSGCAYWENAYYNWLSQNYAVPDTSVETTRTIAEPVEGVSPMYLHLEYPTQNSSRSKSWVWVSDFANDNGQYYSKEEIRYAVIVYRTNDVYAQTQAERNSDDLTYNDNTWGIGDIRFHWAVSDSARSADLTYHTGNSSNKLTDSSGNKLIDISDLGDSIVGTNSSGATKTASGGMMSAGAVSLPPSTDEWSYLVYDMYSGDIKDYFWNSTCTINGSVKDCIGDDRIAGVKVTIPINDQGEAMDISHIAYFSSQAEADNFGAAALRFNNDPGEYLLSVTTVTEEGITLPSHTSDALDFADGAGFSDGTYTAWGSSATRVNNGTRSYAKLSTSVSSSSSYSSSWNGGSNSAYVCSGIYSERTDVRYVTLVYRTDSLPSNAKIGFWVEGYKTDATSLYAAGAGSARTSTTMVTLPQSSTEWVSYTYDLSWINIEDSDYSNVMGYVTHIGMFLPTSGTLEIAYIDYHATLEQAHTFGEDAAHYMNENSTITSAPSPSAYAFDFVLDKYESTALSTWGTAQDSYTTSLNVRDIETTNHGYLNISDADYEDGAYDATYFLTGVKLAKANTRYLTIVYRTHNLSGVNTIGFWVDGYKSDGATAYSAGKSTTRGQWTTMTTLPLSETKWTYKTFDLQTLISAKDGEYNTVMAYISDVGVYLPGFTNSSQSLDIAYIDYYSDSGDANSFGATAAQYMNNGSISVNSITTPAKGWNTGNNTGFSMLYANSGGGWYDEDNLAGGNNSRENGFYSYQIGKTYYKTETESTINSDRETAATKGYPVSNSIFLLNMYNFDELDTEVLDLGYTLYNHAAQGLEGGGVYTIGLLEAGLIDVKGVDDKTYKIPQYKEDSVGYIAYLLRDSLKIGQRDSSGNYNYNFVHGARNGAQYGYADTAKTQPYDLAEALRAQLDLKMPDSGDGNFTVDTTKRTEAQYLGSYADTLTKKDMLIGPFLECVEALETAGKQLTCYDAAYYLLHNIFVDDSYNQLQDDYNYLVLSKGKISATGKEAYVFDGGFTTGTTGASITTDDQAKEYAQTSNSAVQYSPIVTTTDADGKTVTTGKGTIELSTAISKDVVWYDNDASRTTRFPFLPVTDPDENTPYADPMVVNMLDDGARSNTTSGNTYAGRNYNFVMQANGEFVYHYEDELFFEFQGDDDVYLFVNGQLIMDIGGAHSITTVSMNMNDYGDWARGIKADATAYAALTAAEKVRVDALALKDGDSYSIDFYYMERHGWGSNMRVATNIVMTDPALQTNKTAYQSGAEIPYGGTVTKEEKIEYSFSMTNAGNNKLYRLSYVDNNLGVSLDSTNGLVVTGEHVTDANGGTLDPEDLVITVEGYYDEAKTQPTGAIPIPIADTVVTNEDGTTTVKYTAEENLKRFLYDLQSNSTESGEQDSSLFSGAGLWRHGTVTIRGIWYTMPTSVDVFDNTVFTSAHPSVSSDTVIKGEDTHRIRAVSNAVYFYQWAGHDLYIEEGTLIDALKATMEDSGDCSCKASNVLMLLSDSENNARTYDSITNTGSVLTVNYETPGTKTLTYVTLLQDSNNDGKADTDSSGAVIVKHTIPVVYHVTDVEDSTIVLDYGLKAELTGSGGIYANDSVTIANSSVKTMGLTIGSVDYLDGYTATLYSYDDLNRISFTNAVGSDGKLAVQEGHDGQYSIDDGKLYFTPFDFMDGTYSVKAAVTVHNNKVTPSAVGPANGKANGSYSIDITKEVQMFQTVTVLPANVVYYEDDFDGVTYESSKGDFITHTGSSDSWEQGVDQTIPYGQDPAYQDGGLDTSGGSLTTYHINDEATFASFTFTGTGFEIVGRTNAADSGTMFVKVTDASGAVKYHAPVITEFDNEPNGEGGGEAIYQVPVVRVDGLELGTYDVEISGGLEFDFDADKSLWTYHKGITQEQLADLLDNDNDTYDGKVTGDGLKAWVEAGIITDEERNAICYDANGEAYPIDERTQNTLEFLGPLTPPAYAQEGQKKLYIDGVRVFQPLGQSNANYRGGEDGASFTEIRELVMDGKAAFLHWQTPASQDPLTISSGKITLVENRNGDYEGRQANTIEDYMMAGPNNEVYLRRTANAYQVFALYVSEDPDATNKELQIGIRTLDNGIFANGTASDWISMRFLYVQKTADGGLEEVLLDVVESGTEQYYTIDYTTCPYTLKEDGTKVYMVTILARASSKTVDEKKVAASGMISLTGVKHNGLIMEKVLNDLTEDQYKTGTTWEFVNGVLQDTTTGQTLSCAHFDLEMLKAAATLEDTTDVELVPEVEKEPVDAPEVTPLAPVVEPAAQKKWPVYAWVIVGVAVTALMAGAYLLTKKYLDRL